MPKSHTARPRRTLIKIAIKKTDYTAGIGAVGGYEIIKAQIATNPDGTPVYTDCFYCDWQNAFGLNAIQLEQTNVAQPARVRMPYVRNVYEALQSKTARIYKNGREDPAHTFVLNSSVDNVDEQNKSIEFQVKHNEVK